MLYICGVLIHSYTMIQIQNLGFAYGRTPVLRGIDMTLTDGHIYGLLGENGVGKTTLLALLCGLQRPTMGSISIDGHVPYQRRPSFLGDIFYLSENVPPVAQRAADFMAERGPFWPKFSAEKFMSLMRELDNDPGKRMDRMSAGQLKKTYISFALACNTKHLLLDEPTNGLDIPSKALFRSALMRHTADDALVVITTHQVRDLESVVDPIVILDQQEVLLSATLDEIASRLYFDYSTQPNPDALYCEQLPGSMVQVYPNTSGVESKVNVEALFNAVHRHKQTVKDLFNCK